MADTRSIQELPMRGSARATPQPDGRIQVRATHAIALLRLIEREGGLDIRVTAGEWQVLRSWPRWPLRLTLADGSRERWAQAAVELLQAGPPPAAARVKLALLGLGVFTATWLLLHLGFDRPR